MTTILSQIYSPIQKIEQTLRKIFSDPQFFKKKKTGAKLKNLLHSSPQVEFFKLFITYDFVT